jgi:hypothetical protein
MTPKTKRQNKPQPALPANTAIPSPAVTNAGGMQVQTKTKLELPGIDPELTRLGAIERTAETLRYSALRAEHWLSPTGLLREWLRRILQLAVAVVVPVLVFAPVITALLKRLAAWSADAVIVAQNLSQIPLKLSSGVMISVVGYLLLRWLMRK